MRKQNFSTIITNETSKEFYKKLTQKLSTELNKYFGKKESDIVLEHLHSGLIKIHNPENYLLSLEDLNDTSLSFIPKDLKDYINRCIIEFKRKAEIGETSIKIQEFFFRLAQLIKEKEYYLTEDIESLMENFLLSLSCVEKQSPYHIKILDVEATKYLQKQLDINKSTYEEIIDIFLDTYYKFTETYPDSIYLPSIEVLNITQREEQNKPLKVEFCSYNEKRIYSSYQKLLEKGFIKRTLVNIEQYEKTFNACFSNVSVNCNNITYENLDTLIGIAQELVQLRYYYFQKEYPTDSIFKISLEQVTNISSEFLDFIQQKERKIRSLLNKEFVLEVIYKDNLLKNSSKEGTRNVLDFTHIRVISDIHADYNKNKGYEFSFGNDYVINCGDTAGNHIEAVKWLKKYQHKGLFIAGNHLGYSSSYPELDNTEEAFEKYSCFKHLYNTKQSQIHHLSRTFSGRKGIRFMSNSEIEIDGVIILGTTLYTDFALYGNDHIEESMHYAQEGMNDFRLVYLPGSRNYEKKDGKWEKSFKKRKERTVRLFTPIDHAYYFKYSFNFLKERVNENKNKKIIIVTHHAPTPHAISPQYAGSMLNPAFASNLNEFIIENPQIRLWSYGHIHSPADFILGETRLVCCPFGYNNENNTDLPNNYGKRIAFEDIKSSKSWTKILEKEIKDNKVQVYKK